MILPVQAPGFEGQSIEVLPSNGLRGPRLLLSGQPAPAGPKRNEFQLRRNDGQPATAKFRFSFPTSLIDPIPTLEIDGQLVKLADPLPLPALILAGLPLLMVFAGGAVGGLVGAITVIANGRLLRSAQPTAVRYLGVVGVGLVGVAVWLLLATLLTAALRG